MEPEEAINRINKAFGGVKGYRTLHAKGRFYAGTFTAAPEAKALSSAAHLTGEPVPVVVRWSNGGGKPAPDKEPDVRGMAVSFRPTNGATTDLLGQTSSRFPMKTAEEFVALTEAAAKPYKLPLFLAKVPRAIRTLPALGQALKMPYSFAEATYYPIHAYGWVAVDGTRTWVRYRLTPQATESDRLSEKFSGDSRLQEEMAARLARGPVRFDLTVTVAADGDDPHDPTSVWQGAREFSAGTIEVTSESPDPEAGGGVVVFDPARVVPGIELSDDPILRYRPAAYGVSVDRRLKK